MTLDSVVQRLPIGVIVGFLIGAFTVLICWVVLEPYSAKPNASVVWSVSNVKCVDPAPQVAYAYCKGMLDVATRERITAVCDVDGVRYNNTGLVNGSWFVVNYSRGFVYE